MSDFQLPYGVATFPEWQQRAYVKSDGEVHWLYHRLHDFVGLQKEPHKMLYENKQSLHDFLVSSECSPDVVCYGRRKLPTAQNADWKAHTLESRGFLLYLLWLMQDRPVRREQKQKALKLLSGTLALAFLAASAGQPVQVSANVLTTEGVLVNSPLNFTDQGLCLDGWATLLSHCPAARQLWDSLRQKEWLHHCISSDVSQASFADIVFFMAYVRAHKFSREIKNKNVWDGLWKPTFPLLAVTIGQWLDRLANIKKAEALQCLPILRNKHGQVLKNFDPVNRMLYLFKIRKEKAQRRRVGLSHGDVVSVATQWAKREAFLDCVLHGQALLSSMQGHPKQISLSWDPSTYGGKEIMVVMGYSAQLQKGFYAFNQLLAGMRLSDLDDSLIKTARAKKLERLEGYNELRGLGRSLESVGMQFADFRVPEGFFLRPLNSNELRVVDENGAAWVYNEDNQQPYPEVPIGYDWGALPALVSGKLALSRHGSIEFFQIVMSNAQYNALNCQFHMLSSKPRHQ